MWSWDSWQNSGGLEQRSNGRGGSKTVGRRQGFMIKGVAISLEVELNLKGRGQELE